MTKETTMAAQRVDGAAEDSAAGTRGSGESQGRRGDQRGRRLGHGPADKPGGTADIWSMPSTQEDERNMEHGRMEHVHKHESRARTGSTSGTGSARASTARDGGSSLSGQETQQQKATGGGSRKVA